MSIVRLRLTRQLRLKNCIQTILDLEPQMHENGEDSYDDEFSFLRNYLKKIDNMDLIEEDVLNLENVTSVFLAEIERSHCWKKKFTRYLQ